MSHPGRQLPPLHALLERRAVRALGRRVRREVIVAVAREVLDEERSFLARGKGLAPRYGDPSPDRTRLTRHVEARLLAAVDALLAPRMASVINATGVLLHTNLGRAPLSPRALGEIERVASGPVALEIDLESGRRGSRNERVGRWLRYLTGAEAGLCVNNGAAALWLAVQGLAPRRQAVISRGEQVAIGGSFRMPDLLRSTAARVVEVGTTNKTRLADYDRVLREGDVVVKVHPSNYRIEGFAEEASLDGLGALCRKRGARLIFDAGSGSLYNFGRFGLEGELPVADALKAGAHVVTFSGDKLLGGPQAGLLVGEAALLHKLSRHPMMRALRLDKLVLAALEATLVAYALPDRRPDLPLFNALSLSKTVLRERAKGLAQRLEGELPPAWKVSVGPSEGAVGGGSFAERPVPSMELAIDCGDERETERLHVELRRGQPAVLTRIAGGCVRVDVRTPREEELPILADRIIAISREGGASP